MPTLDIASQLCNLHVIGMLTNMRQQKKNTKPGRVVTAANGVVQGEKAGVARNLCNTLQSTVQREHFREAQGCRAEHVSLVVC